MLKCIAIDDEPLALSQLGSYIKRVPFLQLECTCQNAIEAMEYVSNGTIDLIFLDINMPDLNGMDFVKALHDHPMIIFTTAYPEYAVEGFKVDAVDYLLKPFGYAEFLKSANKALKYYELRKGKKVDCEELPIEQESILQGGVQKSSGDYIFVKSEYRILRICIQDINYVESMSEYVRIFLEGEDKPVITLLSMKKMEETLPADRFMRVHRSYLVNLSKVSEVARMRIIFGKDVYIPIGEMYKDKFNEYIERFFVGKENINK